MITALLSVCCLVLGLHWFLNCRSRARGFWDIPGTKGSFLLGNGYEILQSQVNIFQSGRNWAKQFEQYGLYRQWIWPYGILNIFNPDDAEIILSDSRYNTKAQLYEFLQPWLGTGLLLSDGQKWLSRRKILTPAFHFKILKHFSVIIEENSWKLVNELKSEIGKEKVDVIPLIKYFTLNSICETAMGTKLQEVTTDNGRNYERAINQLGKLVVERLVKVWLWPDTLFNMLPQGWKQKKVLNVVHSLPQKVIKERRAYIDKHGDELELEGSDDSKVTTGEKKRLAMLDLLLAAERDGLIDHKGITEEVDTFMFEGHDTTAAALCFAFMALANNKHVQDRVLAECLGIFGQSKRPANMKDLGEMKYLECCIKEVLRLYPPVPFISRHLGTPVKLSRFMVPADSECHVHIFDLHRRPDIFPNPELFDPERFTMENSSNRHPFAYIPFSAGPRNCIGQRFAMLEMKSVIQAVIREFQLDPVTRPEDLEFSADLVLRTSHPIYVKFNRRILPGV